VDVAHVMHGSSGGLGGVAVVVAWGAAKLEFVGDCVTGLFIRGDVVVHSLGSCGRVP